MAKVSPKLQKAFNDNAGKIINAEKVETLSLSILNETLSGEEMDQYMAIHQEHDRKKAMVTLLDTETQKKLKAESGDGTLGVYLDSSHEPSNEHLYLAVNFVKTLATDDYFADMTVQYPPDLSKKVEDSLADALNASEDCREKVKQGGLKLKPFSL